MGYKLRQHICFSWIGGDLERTGSPACSSFRLLTSAESGLFYGKHLPVDWKTSHISWVKCLGLKVNTVEPGLRTIALSWGRLLMSARIWAMWLFNVALSFPLTSRREVKGSWVVICVCLCVFLQVYIGICICVHLYWNPIPPPNDSVFAKGEVPVRWSQCTARTGKLCPSICDNPHVVAPAYFLYKRKAI